MTVTTPPPVVDLPLRQWHEGVTGRVNAGDRLGGVYCTHRGRIGLLHALVVGPTGPECLRTALDPDAAGKLSYPSLTPQVPAGP